MIIIIIMQAAKDTTGKMHSMSVSLTCITKRHNFFNSFTFSVFINCFIINIHS